MDKEAQKRDSREATKQDKDQAEGHDVVVKAEDQDRSGGSSSQGAQTQREQPPGAAVESFIIAGEEELQDEGPEKTNEDPSSDEGQQGDENQQGGCEIEEKLQERCGAIDYGSPF